MNRTTIADVAREAGVSRQTGSRVLNDEAEISASTCGSVVRVIERLGYSPSGVARSLAANHVRGPALTGAHHAPGAQLRYRR